MVFLFPTRIPECNLGQSSAHKTGSSLFAIKSLNTDIQLPNKLPALGFTHENRTNTQ